MKNNLKKMREASIDPKTTKPYTQKGFGEAIGLDENTVRRIENGVRDFTLSTLGRSCEVLDCDPNDLVDFPKPKNSKNFDRDIMELAIGFTLEACHKFKVNIDKNRKQISQWTTQVYEGKTNMHLKVPQMKELAFMLVKSGQKDKKG